MYWLGVWAFLGQTSFKKAFKIGPSRLCALPLWVKFFSYFSLGKGAENKLTFLVFILGTTYRQSYQSSPQYSTADKLSPGLLVVWLKTSSLRQKWQRTNLCHRRLGLLSWKVVWVNTFLKFYKSTFSVFVWPPATTWRW